MARCQKCGDTGILSKPGSETLVECACALIRRLAASMPPHIRRANAVKAHFELPLVRNPFRSVYMVASWADVKAMVKAVIMLNPQAFVKVTSDREILDVFLGKKSKGARDLETRRVRTAAELEDTDASYSSIEDLMDQAKLCVVRLNEIGYKNKSASGALEEAVSYRVDRDKPVWVVSDMNKPFVQGCPAWGESVWEYIRTTIPSTQIPRIAPTVPLELTDDGGQRFVPAQEPPAAAGVGASAQSRMTAAAASPAAPRKAAADPAPFDLEPAPPPEARERRPARRVNPSEDDDARPAGLEIYGRGLGFKKNTFRKD
jgi:hypothetical protein